MMDGVSSLSPENRRVAVTYIALTDDLLTCWRLLDAKGNITLTVWKPLSVLTLTELMLLFHLEGDVLISLSSRPAGTFAITILYLD